FFFSSRRRHTRFSRDWSSDVCSSDLCAAGAFPMARLELYFGTQRPGGAPVTEAEWAAFLDEKVTPRFPDGLTVLTGNGQWRNSRSEERRVGKERGALWSRSVGTERRS